MPDGAADRMGGTARTPGPRLSLERMVGASFPHYDSGSLGAMASVEESLHRLRTDCGDVLLTHRPV